MQLIWLAIALIVGICLGMSLQWLWQPLGLHKRRDKAYIRRLEDMREDAYDEMVQQEWCCQRVAELEARIRELEEDDEDDTDDFDQDDPEYVAGVEATLRAWAEADRADEAIRRPIYNEGNLL